MEKTCTSAVTVRNLRSQRIILILCVIAANVVFIGQAFHMDDGIYLLLARNIARSPWFPQDFPTYFEGVYARDLASTEHPMPVTSYYIAWVGHFVYGLRESSLHLAYLVFPLMLACSMFALARRYTAHPLLASLTLTFLPAVYVLSHTLMTDIPQLALWVTSVALFITGIESQRRIRVWVGAFAAALACLVSYASFCLIPLLAAFAMSRKDYRALVAVLIHSTVLVGTWLLISLSHYGRLPPAQLFSIYFGMMHVLSPALLLQKLIYIALAIGGVMIFPLGLLLSSRKSWMAAALVLSAPAMWFSGAWHYTAGEKLLFVLLFCAGVGAIGESICDFISGRETELFLGAWLIGMLLFTAIFYMTGSARYLFAAIPPFVLLFCRRIERLWEAKKLLWIAWANVVLGGTLAITLAAADYEFAGIYREFASQFHEQYPAARHRTWFAGEWGLRAYLEASGAQELGRRDGRPRKGDVLAVPTLATPYATLFDDQLPLDSIVVAAPSEIRFPIPAIPRDSVLALTVGIPFPEQSDGVNLGISFETPDGRRPIYSEHIAPGAGANWTTRQLPLTQAGGAGTIVFSSDIAGNDAVANWISIARARISTKATAGELISYDFRQHLAEAKIDSTAGMQYYTPGNIPVFPMRVWLRQSPATILRGTYSYRIASPIRLLDATVHAGFWSMGWGVLPFSFARKNSTLETIRVYEINRDIDAYGETTPDWYSSP